MFVGFNWAGNCFAKPLTSNPRALNQAQLRSNVVNAVKLQSPEPNPSVRVQCEGRGSGLRIYSYWTLTCMWFFRCIQYTTWTRKTIEVSLENQYIGRFRKGLWRIYCFRSIDTVPSSSTRHKVGSIQRFSLILQSCALMQSNEYRFEAMLAYNQAWYHGNTWKHGTNLQPAPDRHYRVQSSSSLAHTQNTSSSQTLVSTFLWFRQLDTMIVFFSLSFFSLSLSLSAGNTHGGRV